MFTYAPTQSSSIKMKYTMSDTSPILRLQKLYQETSKHSNYQVLPPIVQKLLDNTHLDIKSRHENERMVFISQHVDFTNRIVFDIGGNTGYFSFEALGQGAAHAHYIEGNEAHSQFVACASEALEMSSSLTVRNTYCDFQSNTLPICQIGIVLNVLHHLGDDFGDSRLDMNAAKKQIIKNLNWLASYAEILVFQMGFCWKGNRNLLLFEKGTKLEMIDFVKTGTAGFWKLEAIGIAERQTGNIIYRLPSISNLERDDSLGEFLNRPVFILSRTL